MADHVCRTFPLADPASLVDIISYPNYTTAIDVCINDMMSGQIYTVKLSTYKWWASDCDLSLYNKSVIYRDVIGERESRFYHNWTMNSYWSCVRKLNFRKLLCLTERGNYLSVYRIGGNNPPYSKYSANWRAQFLISPCISYSTYIASQLDSNAKTNKINVFCILIIFQCIYQSYTVITNTWVYVPVHDLLNSEKFTLYWWG